MHDIFSREPDPLDGLLRPPSAPDNAVLRQQVYAKTQRMLQRRRRWRRLAYAAALAASFVAGLGVMRLVTPRQTPVPHSEPEVVVKQPEKPPLSPDRIPQATADESALARENVAFDSTEHRGERYRQAGDTYMNEEYDPQSALRCYKNALESGTKNDLAISTNDNWLLMAIKDARQKETDHAKQGG